MKKGLIPFLALIGLFFLDSCADPDLAPIITFDQAGKGAYARLLEETDRNYNLFDLASSSYTYSVEFVDLEKGDLVAEYNLDVTFDDNNPDVAGDKGAGPVRWKSFTPADFTTSENGFKAMTGITVSASEMLSLFGLTQDDIGPGDRWIVDGEVVLNDGSSYRASNSSAAVNGAAFQGHLLYRLTAVCPSDIGGAYTTVFEGESTDGCCAGTFSGTGEVTLTDKGGGLYTINDFSGGLYKAWYGPDGGNYGITDGYIAGGGMARDISDVCNVIEGSFTEPFGESASVSGALDPATGIITYTFQNGYGDVGRVTLTPK